MKRPEAQYSSHLLSKGLSKGTLAEFRVSDVADTRVLVRSFLCRSQWQAEVRVVPRLTSRR